MIGADRLGLTPHSGIKLELQGKIPQEADLEPRVGPRYAPPMALVDVVVVSYNSAAHLRDCVAPLASMEGTNVIVVDNASADGSLRTVADLPLTAIQRAENAGFAAGCNEGWRAGEGRYVLFLNPDAALDGHSLNALVAALQADESLGAVAPRIERPDGSLAWSQRRFPRLRSSYARALFLHRLFPRVSWADELIRDVRAYEKLSNPEWVSGACLLVRRSALEEIGGWDDGFFLYGEDIDFCRRLRERGYTLLFEPSARAMHAEGASAPRSDTLPLLVASRLRYDSKHRGRAAVALDRVAIALNALTHMVVSRGGKASRAGHARALRVALRPASGRR